MLGQQVVLNQLKKAYEVLTVPYNQLPELKDNNGNTILDARDKRLHLLEKHVSTAGDILNLCVKANTAVEQSIQFALSAQFPDQLKEALTNLGIPQDVVAKMIKSGGPLPEGEEEDDIPKMGFHTLVGKNSG